MVTIAVINTIIIITIIIIITTIGLLILRLLSHKFIIRFIVRINIMINIITLFFTSRFEFFDCLIKYYILIDIFFINNINSGGISI